MTEQLILLQLKQMPENLRQEVLDFIEYLFTKHNIPKKETKRPQFGSAKGKYQMSPDFDEPLDIFKEYME